MKENKTKILILVILVVSVIAVTIVNSVINSNKDMKLFKKSIEEIGKDFYINYIGSESYGTILQSIDEQKPISITLFDLLNSSYNIDEKKLKTSKFYKKCDLNKSVILFTPYEPITEDNFDIEIKLEC